ncbi:MAG: zinc carboxypeptidase [Caldilineae bacterium]|nr:MAG: zinc carboxypeptidase [Caldilineae bacterium]
MKRSFLLLFLCLILLSFTPWLSRAQAPDFWLVFFRGLSREQTQALIDAGYDFWGIEPDGRVVFAVSSGHLSTVQQTGLQPAAIEPLAFPPDFDDYHDYAEMVSDLQDVAAAYPHITRLQSLGQSHEGRDIWALRITDNPDRDEPDEEGVLIFANTHAREHLTLEQALYLIHDLVENYGREGEATNLVNERDIWVIPNLNPDGTEYDIDRWTGSSPPYWRKNRRDNKDGTFGVDLNRNFPYRWGCCGGSSGSTASILYRGPSPGSEPETQVLMQFARTHPHLTISVSLHTWGELVLYPYGYTYSNIPPDMTVEDHDIFVALSRGIARLNGYHAQQASDLYITDGDSDDWLYGELGIYAVTWELYPRSSKPGFYPPASVIPQQTERNRAALRYVIAQADDPKKVIDAGADMVPPSIQITAPSASDTLLAYRPITVTAAISDNVGVTTVEYLLDGQPVAIRSASEITTTLILPAGTYRLSARAFDHAHWQGESSPLDFTVIEDPGATPTASPTPTITPSPSATPTATSTPTPAPCRELLINGGFEDDLAWTFPITGSTAGYTTAQAHTGSRSARFGLLPHMSRLQVPERRPDGELVPAGQTWSTGYQMVTLPADAASLTLSFWYYPASDDTAGDSQSMRLLRPNFRVLATLMSALENDRAWKSASFDLSPYRGRTVYVYFEVINDSPNDGREDKTWMFVDDVSVQACVDPTPTPTPTPTLTSSPSPTPSLTPTLTPTPTPSPTAASDLTPTATPTFAPVSTLTMTPTLTPSPASSPTSTPSPTPTSTPSGHFFLPLILTRP